MKPLATNRRVLAWLRVLPYENSSTKLSLLHSILYAILVVFLAIGFPAAALFFLKFVKNNLVESLYAIFQIIVYFPLVNGTIIVLLKRQKVLGIFQSLMEIYNESKLFIFDYYTYILRETITLLYFLYE